MTDPKKPDDLSGGGAAFLLVMFCLFVWWWCARTPDPPAFVPPTAHTLSSVEIEDAVEAGTEDLRESLSQMEQTIDDQENELRRLRNQLNDERTR
jgi:hypothetical protein